MRTGGRCRRTHTRKLVGTIDITSAKLPSSRRVTYQPHHQRIPAGEIERIVGAQIRNSLGTPEVVISTWKAARSTLKGITEAEVREALISFQPLWDELFPAEQARIVQQLVERVQIKADCVEVVLRVRRNLIDRRRADGK